MVLSIPAGFVLVPKDSSYIAPGQPIITQLEVKGGQEDLKTTLLLNCAKTHSHLQKIQQLSLQIVRETPWIGMKEAVANSIAAVLYCTSLFPKIPKISNDLVPLEPYEPKGGLLSEAAQAVLKTLDENKTKEELLDAVKGAIAPFLGKETGFEFEKLSSPIVWPLSTIAKSMMAALGLITACHLHKYASRWLLYKEAERLEKALPDIEAELSESVLSHADRGNIAALFRLQIANFKQLSLQHKANAWPKMCFSASLLAALTGTWFGSDAWFKGGTLATVFFGIADLFKNGLFPQPTQAESTQQTLQDKINKFL